MMMPTDPPKYFSPKRKREPSESDYYSPSASPTSTVSVVSLPEVRFREEAALLAELRHPNVVLFIGACVRSPNVCIVTEWIRKGSLRDVLADGSAKLPWSTRLGVVKGIALGLAYRHSQEPAPILHRDLKSSNVLIDESWNAKICDFGLARMKEENATKLP